MVYVAVEFDNGNRKEVAAVEPGKDILVGRDPKKGDALVLRHSDGSKIIDEQEVVGFNDSSVSREHLWLQITKGKFYVQNMSGTNGAIVFIRTTGIPREMKPGFNYELHKNDYVVFGRKIRLNINELHGLN